MLYRLKNNSCQLWLPLQKTLDDRSEYKRTASFFLKNAIFPDVPIGKYCRVIYINSAHPTTLNDYQVLITLNTDTLGNPYNGINSDGSNLVFTSKDGTQLPYYALSFSTTGESKLLVKVPMINYGESYIYMWYTDFYETTTINNTIQFNGHETLELYENFNSGPINKSSWNYGFSNGNGNLSFSNGTIRAYHGWIQSKKTFNPNIEVEYRVSLNGDYGSGGEAFDGLWNGTSFNSGFYEKDWNGYGYNNGSRVTCGNIINRWRTSKIKWTTSQVKLTKGDGWTRTTNNPYSNPLSLRFEGRDNWKDGFDRSAWVDYVTVRKCVDQEPISEIGVEILIPKRDPSGHYGLSFKRTFLEDQILADTEDVAISIFPSIELEDEWTIEFHLDLPLISINAILCFGDSGDIIAVENGIFGVKVDGIFYGSGLSVDSLTINKTHSLCIVGKLGTTSFYVNGNKAGESTAKPSGNITNIGNSSDYKYPFGAISHFKVYSIAKTDKEITADYLLRDRIRI